MIKWILGSFLICWFLFLAQSFLSFGNFQILGTENFLVIKTKKGILWGWGTKNESLLKSLNYFFSDKNYFALESLPKNSTIKTNNVEIKSISSNFIIGTWENTRILFFKSASVSENIKKQPIQFKADFWVLENNNFPDFLPPPQKAILLLSTQKASKKLNAFAQKNKTALITIKNSDSFFFEKKNNVWKIKTR